jgi:WbqC-like protein family
MIILPTAYFPNIEYFKILFEQDTVFVDGFERYEKQTFRNRTTILTANGVLNLSIPVVRPSGKNTLINEVEISNAEDWRKDHLKAIESAYRNTPYFEYYWDAICDIINADHKYLYKLNFDLCVHLIEKVGLSLDFEQTSEFIDFLENDWRKVLHPKKQSKFKSKHYIQTFEERFGFQDNLSILDLLFNEGPNSISILQESN